MAHENIRQFLLEIRQVSHISLREKCFLVLFLLGILACCLQYLFNKEILHYTLLQHKRALTFELIGGLAFYYFSGVLIENGGYRRVGLLVQVVMKNIALYTLGYYTAIFLLTTPFPGADKLLQSWDHAIGYHTLPMMEWVAKYPFALTFFHAAYAAWGFELLLLPCVWALLGRKTVIEKFYLAWMICLIIGGAMYYVLPATGPATVVHSPLFTDYDNSFVKQFFNVHHHIVMRIRSFGIITIPSFHVIAALLIIYYTRDDKFLFYPLLALNILLILSTLVLGKHYLVDLIASSIVAPFSIYLSNRCSMLFFAKSTTTPQPHSAE